MRFRLVIGALVAALAAVLAPATAHAQYAFTQILVPGAVATAAYGINNLGQIVGDYSAGGRSVGFLYSNGTYTTIDVPGSGNTYVQDVNDAGQIVGYYAGATNLRGFLYSGGVYTTIDVPGAQQTSVFGINDLGQMVGWYVADNLAHGFLYDHGTFTTLGFQFGADINDVGLIVGDRVLPVTPSHGMLDDHGVLTQFDPPGSVDTRARGNNAAGEIVGYYSDPGLRATHGFVYARGAFITLDVPWPQSTYAQSINDAGQIVGRAAGLSSFDVGFLATPITAAPEPATWVLVTTGLLATAALARGRRA
jgi:probable HAF family extracellular repeat protein